MIATPASFFTLPVERDPKMTGGQIESFRAQNIICLFILWGAIICPVKEKLLLTRDKALTDST